MEKYARQAISEGLKTADDLHVAGDSELYRVLNLHYNRNNHIEVSFYCKLIETSLVLGFVNIKIFVSFNCLCFVLKGSFHTTSVVKIFNT